MFQMVSTALWVIVSLFIFSKRITLKGYFNKPFGCVEINGFQLRIWHIFAINFFLILLATLPNAQLRFSTDNFAQMQSTSFQVVGGRYVASIIFKLCTLLGYDTIASFQLKALIQFTCGTILLSFINCVLIHIFTKFVKILDVKRFVLVIIAVLFGNCNLMFQSVRFWDMMTTIMWTMGLAFIAISVYFFFCASGKKRIVLCALFLFLGLGTYQLYIQYFFAWGLTFLFLKHEKFNKMFLNDLLWAIGICGVTLLLYLLTIAGDVTANARGVNPLSGGSYSVLLENIKTVLPLFSTRLIAFGTALDMITTKVLIVLALIALITRIKEPLTCVKIILLSITVFALCNTTLIIGSFWGAGRLLMGYGCLGSCLILYIASYDKKRIAPNYVVQISLVVILIFTIFGSQSMIIGQFTQNKIDEETAAMIKYEIDKYEKENSVEIKNIAAKSDMNTKWHYRGMSYFHDEGNLSAFAAEWSRVTVINFYTNSHYTSVEMDDTVWAEHFAGKDWNFFNAAEQLVFVGDTLYMATP